MSMSIFQLLMLLFVWKPFWQSSPPTVSNQYTYSMHLLGHPAYECEFSFWRWFIYSEINLNCVEPRVLNLFTKVHQFDLVLTDTENMTSHYVGLCQNIKP